MAIKIMATAYKGSSTSKTSVNSSGKTLSKIIFES